MQLYPMQRQEIAMALQSNRVPQGSVAKIVAHVDQLVGLGEDLDAKLAEISQKCFPEKATAAAAAKK